jgi:hypothetical protein
LNSLSNDDLSRRLLPNQSQVERVKPTLQPLKSESASVRQPGAAAEKSEGLVTLDEIHSLFDALNRGTRTRHNRAATATELQMLVEALAKARGFITSCEVAMKGVYIIHLEGEGWQFTPRINRPSQANAA